MQFVAFDVDVNVTLVYVVGVNNNAQILAVDNQAGNTAEWGIQDFARIFKITPRTLRFYEDKGLISPQRHNGSRVFGPRDYVRTERIIRAKDLGFSLDDIKDLFEVIDGSVAGKTALLERKDRMETAVSQLKRNRKNIDSAIEELETLIGRIEAYAATADEDGVFQHAAAYEAMFSQTLADSDEDYILGYPARNAAQAVPN